MSRELSKFTLRKSMLKEVPTTKLQIETEFQDNRLRAVP